MADDVDDAHVLQDGVIEEGGGHVAGIGDEIADALKPFAARLDRDGADLNGGALAGVKFAYGPDEKRSSPAFAEHLGR
jgi:hypothetical protein